jgi:hypothetical protein
LEEAAIDKQTMIAALDQELRSSDRAGAAQKRQSQRQLPLRLPLPCSPAGQPGSRFVTACGPTRLVRLICIKVEVSVQARIG